VLLRVTNSSNTKSRPEHNTPNKASPPTFNTRTQQNTKTKSVLLATFGRSPFAELVSCVQPAIVSNLVFAYFPFLLISSSISLL
jgi:hypothetical protein